MGCAGDSSSKFKIVRYCKNVCQKPRTVTIHFNKTKMAQSSLTVPSTRRGGTRNAQTSDCQKPEMISGEEWILADGSAVSQRT